PLLVAMSIALLTRLPVDGNYFINVLPSTILMPFGMGMTFMPIIAAATSGVAKDRSGLAAGLINTSQQMGGALGLSVLSGIAASVTASSVHLGKLGSAVRGYDQAFLVAVIFLLFAAFLAITIIKEKRHSKDQPVSGTT